MKTRKWQLRRLRIIERSSVPPYRSGFGEIPKTYDIQTKQHQIWIPAFKGISAQKVKEITGLDVTLKQNVSNKV